jgi:hypothetical protein
MLSKESLVEIVDMARKVIPLLDGQISSWYTRDLVLQLNATQQQIGKIEERTKNKKLTRSEYAALCKKHNQLCSLFHKKYKIYEELENATDKS